MSSACLLHVCALALGFQLCRVARSGRIWSSVIARWAASVAAVKFLFPARPPGGCRGACPVTTAGCLHVCRIWANLGKKEWRVRCACAALLAACVCSYCSSLRVTRLGSRPISQPQRQADHLHAFAFAWSKNGIGGVVVQPAFCAWPARALLWAAGCLLESRREKKTGWLTRLRCQSASPPSCRFRSRGGPRPSLKTACKQLAADAAKCPRS